MKYVTPLFHARTPIIKFQNEYGAKCDLCFNRLLGVYNTQLQRDYAAIDERVAPLVVYVSFIFIFGTYLKS